MEQYLENTAISDAVEVKVTQHYVCLNMKGALLFGSASADLTPEAMKVLDEVSKILKMYEDHLIEIEGHTDNVIANNEKYPSNWELSAERAINVLHYLADYGVDENSFSVAGYADTRPKFSNDTPEGRAYNRRVDIIILDEGHF